MSQKPKYHHGNLRDAIIENALETIRNQGVAQVSLRAIARDIGVSHAAPARHFASRDALLSDIALMGFKQLTGAVRAAGQTQTHPVAQLRVMGRAFLTWVHQNSVLYNAMRHPDVIRHAAPELRAGLANFASTQAQVIKEAQGTGWNAEMTNAAAFLSVISGLSGFATILTESVTAEIFEAYDVPAQIDAVLDRWIGKLSDYSA